MGMGQKEPLEGQRLWGAGLTLASWQPGVEAPVPSVSDPGRA